MDKEEYSGAGWFGFIWLVVIVCRLFEWIKWSWWIILIPLTIAISVLSITILILVAGLCWDTLKEIKE